MNISQESEEIKGSRMTNSTDNILYDWLFHYNHHTKLWATFKREHQIEYFNGEYKNVLRSTSFHTLQKILMLTEGDLEKADNICKMHS